MAEAVITSVAAVPTHDGEAALVITLSHPEGGVSHVPMSGRDGADIVARAGKSDPGQLVGMPWTVLQIRETTFV